MTMAWRATLKMRRNFEQFFDVTLQPLLFTAMFAGIFGGAISGSVDDYLPLLIPGLIAQTVLTACVATGTQIREDMDKGVFDRFKVLPISRIAPLAGPMVADMIRYAIAATLTFATGIVMGYRPGGGVVGVFAAILLAIIAGWSLAWIFTWFGTVGKSAQAVQGYSPDGDVPADVPVQRVRPGRHPAAWLEAFTKINPVSHIITALRDLANTGVVTPRSAGRWSAAWPSSRSSRRCRCAASPGRCEPPPVQHRPGLLDEIGRRPVGVLRRHLVEEAGARLARPARPTRPRP